MAKQQKITQQEHDSLLSASLTLLKYWKVNDRQAAVLLGGIAYRQLGRIKSGETIKATTDTADRMRMLLKINDNLTTIFGDNPERALWIKQDNADFAGTSPLNLMLGGHMADIAKVLVYTADWKDGIHHN